MTPQIRNIAGVHFQAKMHAIWLAEGDSAIAARILRVKEEDLLNSLNAGEADACFCGRPMDWKPEDSLAALCDASTPVVHSCSRP